MALDEKLGSQIIDKAIVFANDPVSGDDQLRVEDADV